MRVAFGGPFGLDMGTVMMMGQSGSVDMAMLAEVLPGVEAAILAAFDEEDDD